MAPERTAKGFSERADRPGFFNYSRRYAEMDAVDKHALRRTIDPGNKGGGEGSKAKFSGVQICPEGPAFGRVHVWNKDFRNMAAVDDRSPLASVLVGYVRYDQPKPIIQRSME